MKKIDIYNPLQAKKNSMRGFISLGMVPYILAGITVIILGLLYNPFNSGLPFAPKNPAAKKTLTVNTMTVSPSPSISTTPSRESGLVVSNPGPEALSSSTIISSIKAGDGISVSSGNTPTITNTGVVSLGGKTGEIYLEEGGLKFDGQKLYNADKGSAQNIFKTIKVEGEVDIKADTNNTELHLAAGTGIEIDTNNDEKRITINGKSGWIDHGSVVSLVDEADNLRLNGVTYAFPNTQGGAGTFLQNDGNGALTWANFGVGMIPADSLDFTELKDNLTLDANTDIALAGKNFSFSGTGNVGIGTTDPTARLHVLDTLKIDSDSTASLDFGQSGNSKMRFYYDATGYNSSGPGLVLLNYVGGGYGQYVFKRDGRLGIGDINPISHVSINNRNGVRDFLRISSASNNNGDLFLIDSLGRIGVGTTSPQTRLQIVDNNTVSNFKTQIGIGSLADNRGFNLGIDPFSNGTNSFYIYNNATGHLPFAVNGQTVIIGNYDYTTSITSNLYLRATNGGLNVYSSGGLPNLVANGTNVGIGLSAPVAKLDVAGTSWLRGSTGPSGGLYVDGNGNTGIGTTSPVQALDVNGYINTNSGLRISNGLKISLASNYLNLTSGAGVQIVKNSNGASLFTVDDASGNVGIGGTAANTAPILFVAGTSGNVGIGTTNPGYLFDVDGSGQFGRTNTWTITEPSITSNRGIAYINAGGSLVLLGNGSASSAGGRTGINSSNGSVIGTFNVESDNISQFDSNTILAANTGADDIVIENNGATAGLSIITGNTYPGRIYFGDTDPVNPGIDKTPTGGYIQYNHINDSLSLATAQTERIRIDSSGNLGIGTTSPAYQLDIVSGSHNYRMNAAALSYAWGGTERLKLYSPGSGVLHTGLFFYGTEAGIGIPSNGSNTLNFMTAGTEKMRINSSGNVGIGTTNPSAILTVAGDIALSNGADRTISIPNSAVGGSSRESLTIRASGSTSGNTSGGSLNLYAGNSTGIGTPGGVNVTAGSGVGFGGAGTGGDITLTSGSTDGVGSRQGNINLVGSSTTISGGSVTGGSLNLTAGNNNTTNGNVVTGGAGGAITLTLGSGGYSNGGGSPGGSGGGGGSFNLIGGSGGYNSAIGGTGGAGSAISLTSGTGGNATGGSGTRTGGNGGNITIQTGAGGTGASANGTAGSIAFGIGGVEKMRIDNTGNLGIGTTSPNAGFVAGSSTNYIGDNFTGSLPSSFSLGLKNGVRISNTTANINSINQRIDISHDTGIFLYPTNTSRYLNLNGQFMIDIGVVINSGPVSGNLFTFTGSPVLYSTSNNFLLGSYADNTDQTFQPNYGAQGIAGKTLYIRGGGTQISGGAGGTANAGDLVLVGGSINRNDNSGSPGNVYIYGGKSLTNSSLAGNIILGYDKSDNVIRGNVGIGTTAPSFPLDVASTVSSNQTYGYLNSSGVVGTSSGTNTYSIRASGRILSSEFNAVSDARLKDVQFDLDPAVALNAIMQLKPVSFTWKDNPSGQPILGLLAQDVEGVIPNAVSKVATSKFADQRELSYNQLTAVLIGAIKKQQQQIDNISITHNVETHHDASLPSNDKIASIEAALASLKTDVDVMKNNDGETRLIASLPTLSSLDSETATLSALIVSGKSNLYDVGISGTLTAGILNINGLDDSLATASATIETVGGPLRIQPNALSNIEFSDGKIVMDTKGNLTVHGEITAQKINIDTSRAESAAAGTAVVKAGEQSLTVETTAVTENSLIMVTFNTNYAPATRYWIESKNAGTSFTLKLDQSVGADTEFSYMIVN